MKTILRTSGPINKWALLAFPFLLLFCFPAKADDKDTKTPNAGCATWKAESAFVGLAYNHLVHIENKCDHPVSCRVKTDVNPKEETVVVPAKGRKTHLTFRGSPAREFKAVVTCSPK